MPPVYLLARRAAPYLHGSLGDSQAHTLSWSLSESGETPLDDQWTPHTGLRRNLAGKAGWKRARESEASSSTDTDEDAIATPTTAAVDPFPGTMSAKETFPTSSLGDLATALTDAELPSSLSSRQFGRKSGGKSGEKSGEKSGGKSGRKSGGKFRGKFGGFKSGEVDETSDTEPSVATTPEVEVSSDVATATLETSVATEDPDISTTEQQAPTTAVFSLPQFPTASITTETDDPVTTRTRVFEPTFQAPAVPSLGSTGSEEPAFTSPPEPQASSFPASPTGATTAPNTFETTLEVSPPSPAAPLPTILTQAEPAPGEAFPALTSTQVFGTASQTLGLSIGPEPTEPRPTSSPTITASTPLSAGSNENASGSTEPVPSGTTASVTTTLSDAPFPAVITGSSDTLGGLPATTGTTTPLGSLPSVEVPRPDITALPAGVPASPTAEPVTVSDSPSGNVPLSVTSTVVSTFTSEIPIQTTTDSDGRLTTSFSTTTGTTALFTTLVPNPSAPVTSASRPSMNMQGLVGGVVGSFVLLAAAVLAFILMRRRKFKKEMDIHSRLFESPTENGGRFDSDNSPQVAQVRNLDLGTMAEDSAKAADTVASYGQYPFNPATTSPPTRFSGHYVLPKLPPSLVDGDPFADPELGSAGPAGGYTPHQLTVTRVLPGSAAHQNATSASKSAVGRGQGEDPNPFTDPVNLIPSSNPFDDHSVPTKHLKMASDETSLSSDSGVTEVVYAR